MSAIVHWICLWHRPKCKRRRCESSPGSNLCPFSAYSNTDSSFPFLTNVNVCKAALYPVYTIKQTSSWLAQLTYSSSSSQFVEPAWSCKRGITVFEQGDVVNMAQKFYSLHTVERAI